MKKVHKIILFIVLLFTMLGSICISFYLNSNSEISKSTSTIILKLIYDLCIGLFPSILLFFAVDNIISKYNQKEEEKKIATIIGKIKPAADKFYNVFIGLYAGSRENPIDSNSPVLKNLFSEKDNLYNFIITLDYKEKSPFGDINKYDVYFFLKDPNSLPPNVIWEHYWLNEYNEFYQALDFFETNYGIFLSSNLLQKTEDLRKVFEMFFNLRSNMHKIKMDSLPIRLEKNEMFYDHINLKKVMSLFEEFLITLQKESGIDFLTINIEDINNRNAHPLLGELLKSKEKNMNINSLKLLKDLTLVEDFSSYAEDFLLEEMPICKIKSYDAVINDKEFDKIEINNSVFENCTFSNCSFENASFVDVTFQSCDLSNNSFTDAYFERCQFISCKCIGIDMSDTVLKNTSFKQSKLQYSYFDRSRMSNILFDNIDFTEASMTETKLKKFVATDCRFIKNNFFKTMLSTVDFSNNEFVSPIVSTPPIELKGATINMFQAANLIRLWDIIIK